MSIRKIRLWVFSAIGYTAIFIMLITAVFVVVSGKSGKEPFIGGYCVMWVKTDSMNPTIPEKSYILVKKAAPADVATGDVIVFISDDPAIKGLRNVHRVVQITEDENGARSFITRGDNRLTNLNNDSYPASGEKLIGKQIRVFSFLSLMGRLLSDPVGFLVILVMIILILMFIYFPEISRVVREADEIRDNKKKLMDELVRIEVEKLKANGGVLENEDLSRDSEDLKDAEAHKTENT